MFNPRNVLSNNPIHAFSPTWHTNDDHYSWEAMNFDSKAQKTAQNYETSRNPGLSSPPFWKTSPSPSLVHSQLNHDNNGCVSATSRAQAIARAQCELMEMIKNMPESSYELSLKDIVEQTRVEAQEECLDKEEICGNESLNQKVVMKGQRSKKCEKKVKMVRNGSIENRELFLKVVFPTSLESKKKRNLSTKVCTKPEALEILLNDVGKELLEKRFSASLESENTGSIRRRSSSISNRSKKMSGLLPGCLSFFHNKKRKPSK